MGTSRKNLFTDKKRLDLFSIPNYSMGKFINFSAPELRKTSTEGGLIVIVNR